MCFNDINKIKHWEAGFVFKPLRCKNSFYTGKLAKTRLCFAVRTCPQGHANNIEGNS